MPKISPSLITLRSVVPVLAFSLLPVLLAGAPATTQKTSSASRPALPSPLIEASWKRLPNLPQGIVWPAVGIIDGTFVSVTGWCTGEKVEEKPGVYPRKFYKDTLAFNLENPESGWSRLPDFPGTPRIGAIHATVGNRLYLWGGASYTAPYCHKDGWVLEKNGNTWSWRRLAPLPHSLAFAAGCAIGSKIYAVGGADYTRKQYLTAADRDGVALNIGKRVLVFDTENPSAGWKELSPCPGTVRYNAALAAVDGKLYLMGGATGADSPNNKSNTVVDNWRYDPSTNAWTRLADTPVAIRNFSSGEIVYKDRYVLLPGGARFPGSNVQYPDGRIAKLFGKAKMTYTKTLRKDWKGRAQRYVSHVLVYDTQTGAFGEATMLPFNISTPRFVVRGDRLWLISGETGGLIMDGEYYGNNPDFFLEGILQLTTPN